MKYLFIIISVLLMGGCASSSPITDPSTDYVTRDELRQAYECLQTRYEYERQAAICREASSHPEGTLCTDTCGPPGSPSAWVGDGECDDGGQDSLYSVCPLGTDCQDCGPRTSDGARAPGHSQREIDQACAFVVDYFEQCPGIR